MLWYTGLVGSQWGCPLGPSSWAGSVWHAGGQCSSPEHSFTSPSGETSCSSVACQRVRHGVVLLVTCRTDKRTCLCGCLDRLELLAGQDPFLKSVSYPQQFRWLSMNYCTSMHNVNRKQGEEHPWLSREST
uniref:Uncharacterized protein n=1 Tax=Pipistrellus kuhlii TaxID=59472 RepID=A0A7J7ZK03_PIPKU|nr:hypothetical protein mPipKuh1_009584 [Pipistrellus kuhlii]